MIPVSQATRDTPVEYDVVAISKAIGDPLRASILQVLAADAFGVLELVDIFDVAQPALSHHLKKLAEVGLVTKRREGTSVYYQRSAAYPSALLQALFQALDAQGLATAHRQGIQRMHNQRAQRSQHFFSHQRDALAQQKQLICAPEVYLEALLTMSLSVATAGRQAALEVGPGSGELLHALAPHYKTVTGIDNAPEMLNKTTKNTQSLDNVRLKKIDFAALPARPSFDLVIAAMVVHHMPSPAQFFQHAAKLLRKSGLLVVAELCSHDQDWARELCGDVWLGFSNAELVGWAEQAALEHCQTQYLAQNNGFRVQVSTFALSSQA